MIFKKKTAHFAALDAIGRAIDFDILRFIIRRIMRPRSGKSAVLVFVVDAFALPPVPPRGRF
jgi:hypothetical protein